MYAAGKAPLRAVVGANSAGAKAELVCYRMLANSALRFCLPACQSYHSDSGGCCSLHNSSIVNV